MEPMSFSVGVFHSTAGAGWSSFLQQSPAETTGYMVLGLSVILGTMALYIASLVNRRRNLGRDLQVLDQVEGRQAADDPPAGS